MSSSRIIEVKPDMAVCGDYINADWLVDDNHLFSFAEYVYDILPEEHIEAIERLADTTADFLDWHFEPDGEIWFSVKSQKSVEKFFAARLEQLKEKVSNLSLREFADDTVRYRLVDIIEEKYGAPYFRMDGEYYTLDRFLRDFKSTTDTRFYVGGVVNYHY